MPSIQPTEILDKIEAISKNFLKATNFKNGFVNTELWVKPDKSVYIIEINPRSAYPYAD
jgi:predicted ATP-grasp superfamily ATP-dependent carboligase